MEGHNPYYHHHHHHPPPPHPHQQQQLHQHQPNPPQQQNIAATTGVDPSDRFPQWSVQETKELLMIRAELDQAFLETKRNKLLWDVVSTKMKEKGFVRSAEQCKCKWKNLVTRYKGCETMEPEAMRQQFPFYNELQAIFAARMQRMLWTDAEGGGGGGGTSGSKRKLASHLSSDDEDENEESEELLLGDNPQKGMTSNPRKRAKKGKMIIGGSDSVRELLEDFMRQQVQMEREWREMWEARERERAEREREWRRKMEELERERVAVERRWMEKEEERRVREEARAQKRDALISALLDKLTRDHGDQGSA